MAAIQLAPAAARDAVRQAVPDGLPVWIRISVSDRREDGWTVEDTVRFAGLAREAGADLVLLGREMLRDPYGALHAAQRLGLRVPWPDPYGWAVARPR